MRRILKLIYYFMMADGKCTDKERALFSSLCQEKGLSEGEKNELIESCELVVGVFGYDNSARVIKVITALLNEKSLNTFSLNKKKGQVEMIWELINVAYACGEFSEPERKVITYLQTIWSIEETLLEEMIDIIETRLALESRQMWAVCTSKSSDDVTKIMNQVKDDLTELEENIKYLIEKI